MKLSDFTLYLQTHVRDPEHQYDRYCLMRFGDVLVEAGKYVKMNTNGQSALGKAEGANKLEIDVGLDLLDSRIEDCLNSLTTVNPIFVRTKNLVQQQKPGFTYVRQFETAPSDLSSLERMQIEKRIRIQCILMRMKYQGFLKGIKQFQPFRQLAPLTLESTEKCASEIYDHYHNFLLLPQNRHLNYDYQFERLTGLVPQKLIDQLNQFRKTLDLKSIISPAIFDNLEFLKVKKHPITFQHEIRFQDEHLLDALFTL